MEKPYFQHFTSETFFQHRAPIHLSSLSRWRGRIGEEGVEWVLTKTIEGGRVAGAVSERGLAEVAVDTAVMEKAIAHPTDSRLYERARHSLVALAGQAGITLRQTYNRLAPRLAGQVGRYAHARQYRCMRRALRRLKGYTGRVLRDVGRELCAVAQGPLRDRISDRMALVTRLLRRRSAIEPEIGHMKSDGRLACCALKGTLGDALHAVPCGCGHNIRKILAYLRALLSVLLATLLQSLTPTDRRLFCSPSA